VLIINFHDIPNSLTRPALDHPPDAALNGVRFQKSAKVLVSSNTDKTILLPDTDSIFRGLSTHKQFLVTLVKAGVIDPTKVTRTARENAASIAGLLLTN
jgi:5'-3' exonuclease